MKTSTPQERIRAFLETWVAHRREGSESVIIISGAKLHASDLKEVLSGKRDSWRPVSEPPVVNTPQVLGAWKHGGYEIVTPDGLKALAWEPNIDDDNGLTHWMPLPEHPNG